MLLSTSEWLTQNRDLTLGSVILCVMKTKGEDWNPGAPTKAQVPAKAPIDPKAKRKDQCLCFSPAAFRIISLTFAILINVSLGSSSLRLTVFPIPRYLVQENFSHHFIKYIFCPFHSSLSGIPIMQTLVHLMLSKYSFKLFSLFQNFSFCPSDLHYSMLQIWRRQWHHASGEGERVIAPEPW